METVSLVLVVGVLAWLAFVAFLDRRPDRLVVREISANVLPIHRGGEIAALAREVGALADVGGLENVAIVFRRRGEVPAVYSVAVDWEHDAWSLAGALAWVAKGIFDDVEVSHHAGGDPR